MINYYEYLWILLINTESIYEYGNLQHIHSMLLWKKLVICMFWCWDCQHWNAADSLLVVLKIYNSELVYLKIDSRWTRSANQYLNKGTVFISNIHRRKNGFFFQLQNDTRLLLSCIFTLPRPVFGASEVRRRMVLLKLEYITVNNEVRWLRFLNHISQTDKSHLPGPRCYNLQRVLF